MTSTLVGYFDSYEEAKKTEEDLRGSGFNEGDIRLVRAEAETREETRAEPSGFWENMKELFGFARPEEQRYYGEATRHGGAILTVQAPDERVDLAADILERHHPADLDQRFQEWGVTGEAAEPREEETIPVVEEQLTAGKQVVRRGGVRIHQYVIEKPVEATIPLREEEITVERHPVDRPLGAAEGAFQERSFEMEATGEEPIITKEARVVEEVSVGKEATEREETIRETVRKTGVEIEQDPGKKKS